MNVALSHLNSDQAERGQHVAQREDRRGHHTRDEDVRVAVALTRRSADDRQNKERLDGDQQTKPGFYLHGERRHVDRLPKRETQSQHVGVIRDRSPRMQSPRSLQHPTIARPKDLAGKHQQRDRRDVHAERANVGPSDWAADEEIFQLRVVHGVQAAPMAYAAKVNAT